MTDLGTVPDDRTGIRDAIARGLREYDVVLITGGMSMGEYDFVPDVLRELGVELKITKLRIKPGKPFAFGVAPGGKFIFGLPGNPVSGFACTLRLGARLIARLSGGVAEDRWIHARLSEPLGSGSDSWKYWAELRAGTITQRDWQEIEDSIARSPGTCMTMGTAATMMSLAESLGFCLPGAASIPAPDSNHAKMATLTGKRIVDMVWEDLKPSDFLTRESFDNAAVTGVKPEGRVTVRHAPVHGRFADGTPYTLQKPHYGFSKLGYGPMRPDTMLSPRIAPQMIGMGLLEAIPEAEIERNAQIQAGAPGPIKGQPNRVWDAFAQRRMIGRFGWKANVATLAHQTAGAFLGDIGITSSRFPHEACMPSQKDCLAAPRGGQPNIDDTTLGNVVFYEATLAPPARRRPRALPRRRWSPDPCAPPRSAGSSGARSGHPGSARCSARHRAASPPAPA